MLNRRILRIKAMQALYGFYTTRESLKRVVRDRLEKQFTPDALIHDLSDTEEIDNNRKVSLRLYDQNLKAGKLDSDNELSDEVFNAVNGAIQSYYDEVKAEASRTKKTMLDETKNLQDVYHRFLMLPGEFQFLERQESDKREVSRIQQTDSWKYHFLTNPVIESLNTNASLQKEITSKKLSWQNEIETLRSWYKQILKEDEQLLAYQELEAPTDEDHKGAVNYLLKKLIFKSETISGYFEEQNLRWSEDAPILKSMLSKTIQDYDPTQEEPINLKTISINEADDFQFFETIFDCTLKEDEYFQGLIAEKTKNWDVSRLATTDMIILKMALAEMMYCRSIPTKVTINEFIEICKQYSTPKSKQFVNGILDVLANQLTSEGVIKKSGRGLIDNR